MTYEHSDSTTKHISDKVLFSDNIPISQLLNNSRGASRLNEEEALDDGDDGCGDFEAGAEAKENVDCCNEGDVEVDIEVDPDAYFENDGEASLDGSDNLDIEAHEGGDVDTEGEYDGDAGLEFDADGLRFCQKPCGSHVERTQDLRGPS